jgi:serine/threonine-protein kinase
MHTPTRESAAPTPPALEELQEALPQYEMLALIGRGGMGAVYRARQRSLNREVAIKVLRAEALDEFRLPDRFRTEAHAMARLNHPAIVHVHDFGETAGGILYIVMEFVQGTDLHRVLDERSPLSSREAVAITIEVCAALE